MESASGNSPIEMLRGAFATPGRADKPGGADAGTGAASNLALAGRVDADRPEGGDVVGSICRDVTTISMPPASSTLLRLEADVLRDLAEDRDPVLVAPAQLLRRARRGVEAGLLQALANFRCGEGLADRLVEDRDALALHAGWPHDALPGRHVVPR